MESVLNRIVNVHRIDGPRLLPQALCADLRRDTIDQIHLLLMDVYKMDDKAEETAERRRQREANPEASAAAT